MKYVNSFLEFIAESQIYEANSERIIYFPGRFQPFHNGHLGSIKRASEVFGAKVIPVQILSQNSKSPFPEQLLAKIGKDIAKEYRSFIADFIIYKTDREHPNFVSNVVDFIRQDGFEPVGMACGSDRLTDYEKQILRAKQFQEKYGISIPEEFMVKSVDNRDEHGASGTAVRNAISADDKSTFDSMMPPILHKYYSELKKYL